MEDNSIPGFRFYPTEEELISFYLHNKLEGEKEHLNRVINRVIPLLDIYEFNPWDLPQYSGVPCQGDPEQCFFFIPRQESEARGGRPSRLTERGYWKATGSPSYVYSSKNRIIGLKRTMVFYTGRAPHGSKTQWKMNEYKAIQGEPTSGATPMLRQEFSLCRVYKKTKCLRAFDRRPTRAEIINIDPTIHDDHHDNYYDHNHHHHQQAHRHDDDHHQEAATSMILSHQSPPPPPPPPAAAIMERTSSLEDSTSSGGGGSGGQPSQSGDSEFLNLQITSDEALWDWDDQLNNLF